MKLLYAFGWFITGLAIGAFDVQSLIPHSQTLTIVVCGMNAAFYYGDYCEEREKK